MTPARLAELIKSKIDERASCGEMDALVREYKDAGGSQEAATGSLDELRADYRKGALEDEEDRLMELMDRVTGFSSLHLRLWP